MAAHNWRTIRVRYADKGIGNVMAQVNSMHSVLDVMEQIGLESAMATCKTTAEAKTEMTRYFDKLYKPDMKLNGDGYMPPPPGFSDEEMEASFDAFLASGVN